MSEPGLVSVVVIGRNEGPRLVRCLASVQAMERQDFRTEVIYVDSGSSDESVVAAREAGATVIALNAARPTAAMGRNAGWKAARGETILFLDGDTVLDARFVLESLTEFANPAIAVIWGHRREMFARKSLYQRALDLDWVYPAGFAPFCGGDALFRRNVLEQTGGFDDTLIAGEEPELCRRIGGLGLKILHVDRAMTGHDLAITRFGQYWRRATRAGHAYAEVSQRFRDSERPFWREESRGNVLRATVLLTLLLVAVTASAMLRSVWPLAVTFALLGGLCLRTAWKARWKSKDLVALLLYGVHSQLQQIPIFWGQVQFFRNERSGRRAGLVEYKNG